MARLCRRCGGSSWLLRNPERQTEKQAARRSSDSPLGKRFTRCTDCGGSGVKGKKSD